MMVFAHRGQNLQDRRHAVHERKIDRLDTGPKGKSTVRYYQGIRVPHPRQKRQELGIQEAAFDHVE
jgi:hypothetical protein